MVSACQWRLALGGTKGQLGRATKCCRLCTNQVVWRELLSSLKEHTFHIRLSNQQIYTHTHLTASHKLRSNPHLAVTALRKGLLQWSRRPREHTGTETDLLRDLGQVLSLSGLQFLHKIRGLIR